MEITGTLTQLKTKFEEWHNGTDTRFRTLHSSLFARIETLESERNSESDVLKQKILTLANLISSKLDGDTTQINNIENLNSITSKTEAVSTEINLKKINQRLTDLDYEDQTGHPENDGIVVKLKKLIGTDTSSSTKTIFERIKSLEQSNLSTTNIDERIGLSFEGASILTNDNLNDSKYKTPGIYKCATEDIGRTVTNTPVANISFNLVVLRHKNNSVRQIVSEYDNNNMWVRNYRNNTQDWTNWTKLYGEHNTTTFDMEVEFSNGNKTYTLLATEIR